MQPKLNLILLCALVAGIFAEEECGIKGDGLHFRVIGGVDTKPGEYPWMITLGGCGASLINDQWVVTAGHCASSSSNPRTIVLGVHDLSKYNRDEEPNAVEVQTVKSIRHPKYDPRPDHDGNPLWDLSLLKLKNKLDLKGTHKHLRPICLPEADLAQDALAGATCVATGWGITKSSNGGRDMPRGSFPLQQIELEVLSAAECLKRWPTDYVADNQVCAGGTKEGGKSVCNGDSGGPFQCKLEDGKWYLIGAVSYGNLPCAGPNTPDVYARVAAFREWIDETIEANS